MLTVKNITAEAGEECRIDVDILHNTLAKLPAEMYLNLFRKMHMNIYGYPAAVNWGGCCGTLGDTEDNAKYYDEQPKVSKSYSVGE